MIISFKIKRLKKEKYSEKKINRKKEWKSLNKKRKIRIRIQMKLINLSQKTKVNLFWITKIDLNSK